MATKYDPVESFIDWLGQTIEIGSHVLVCSSWADSPSLYTGEVVDLGRFDATFSKDGIVKAKVQPTGLYSRGHTQHVWPTEQDPLTGKWRRVGFPRSNWILATNLTLSQRKVLDYGDRVE